MKLEFFVSEREKGKGNEHIIYCMIGEYYPFAIAEYESAPTDKEIAKVKSIAHRAMEFYHRQIQWPKFEIEDID